MASILGSMARGGKKLIKDTAKNLADKKELKKLKKEDYPSEKQKTRIKELENKINKDKKKEAVKKIKDTLKKSGQRKGLKGKGVDMSMAMNKGGMSKKKKGYAKGGMMKKKGYAAGGVAKKSKVGSMDYRKGGLFK
tara:strand:+ start:432 stop:839 length:408 start_codon:yes stop_codon:yes gene_type:complete